MLVGRGRFPENVELEESGVSVRLRSPGTQRIIPQMPLIDGQGGARLAALGEPVAQNQ